MTLSSAQQKEIRDLVASGQRIAAVKHCREITGLGLNEALQMVNRLAFGASGEAGPGVSMSSVTTPQKPDARSVKEAQAEAMNAIREGHIIEAVKRYRQRTGAGLKDAKDAVDILHLVHHSSGRVNARVAQSVIAAVSAGRREEALTQLMAGAGYDDAEARTFIAGLGRLGIARTGCAGGCLRVVLSLLLLVAAVAAARLAGLF